LGPKVKGNELYYQREELKNRIENMKWVDNWDERNKQNADSVENRWKVGDGYMLPEIYPDKIGVENISGYDILMCKLRDGTVIGVMKSDIHVMKTFSSRKNAYIIDNVELFAYIKFPSVGWNVYPVIIAIRSSNHDMIKEFLKGKYVIYEAM
ncbi:MAG: hypothetical protein ACP5MW_04565, partial [Thermoplasmata archaeon]